MRWYHEKLMLILTDYMSKPVERIVKKVFKCV